MKSFFVACLLAVSGCGGSTTDGGLLGGSTGAGGAVGGSTGAGGDASTGGAAGLGGGSAATGGGGTIGGAGGAPVGAGGAAGGSGSGATSAGGANSPACNECVASGCGTALSDCANDPTCAACAKPGAPLSCFSNQHFDKLLTCSCQACEPVCPSIDCKAVPCLECTGKSCTKQISACEADATCPSCLAKSPPDACKSNQAAVDLYVCDMKHCAGPCGL